MDLAHGNSVELFNSKDKRILHHRAKLFLKYLNIWYVLVAQNLSDMILLLNILDVISFVKILARSSSLDDS